MQLGIVQTSPLFGNKLRNRTEIESLMANARADLWVLPELALTGYEFSGKTEVREFAEEIPNGETCRWLVDLCADRNCAAVIGLAEREGDCVYNSCVLATPKGIVGHYRKIHLFDREKTRFDPGNLPFAVQDIGPARIGMMICFDWRFPEAARTLSLRGAQIVAHPSNLVMPYCQRAMVTRALENRVYFATVNRVGKETRNGLEVAFSGGSVVVNPEGDTLVSLAADRAQSAVVEIDPSVADDKLATPNNDLLKDRRPEFYD